jgi:CrcB protein
MRQDEVGRLSDLDKYLVVLAGAGFGGLARYALGLWIMARYGGRFPLSTMIINVSGSFLAGLVIALLTERLNLHPNWRLFLVVGVLGGYTTFSTFEYEALHALRHHERWLGLFYVTGSVVFGYVAVWLGALLAERR